MGILLIYDVTDDHSFQSASLYAFPLALQVGLLMGLFGVQTSAIG